jgi:uncharacterized protein
VTLAFALSWISWPLYAAGIAPGPLFGAGPFLAAIIVTAVSGGRQGVGSLLADMVRWRVRPFWFAMAVGLPLVVVTLAGGFDLWLGASTPDAGELRSWTDFLPLFLFLLLVPGMGGAWEEPGWRGFQQPLLGRTRSDLTAALIVGATWAVWHAPLWWEGMVPWFDALGVVAMSVVYAWLYEGSGGSVLVVMIAHATSNTVAGGFVIPMLGEGGTGRIWVLLALAWTLTASAVVALSPSMRSTGVTPVQASIELTEERSTA